MQHTFFVHFIVVALYDDNLKLPETSRVTRFMEEVSLLTFFTLVTASISHFPTAATNFPCCSSDKKMALLFLISRSSSLSRFFFRWASLTCRLLSLFLYIPNLWTWINTDDIETISAFCFPFSSLLFGFAISRQNNFEMYLGCHTFWLSYFTLVCLWCGRRGGRVGWRTLTSLPKNARKNFFKNYPWRLTWKRKRNVLSGD